MLILAAIVGLCVLIIVHEGGHFIVARLCGMRVDRFSIGFGPALVKFKRGDTIYQISAIPLGGFVQIAGLNPNDDGIMADDPRSYPNRPVYQRLLTIFAGPGTNYLFAAIMMSVIYIGFGVPVPGKMPMVIELVEGKPAAAAGIKLGDDVKSIDGRAVHELGDVAPIIDASGGRPVQVEVERDGEPQTFTVKPEQMDGKWRIGVVIHPREIFVKVPAGKAVVAGLVFPYEYTKAIFSSFAEIISHPSKAEFQGPIGIVRSMKGQMKRGPAEGLSFIAIISVYLGLFNLLPLPALDGGRLIFLVVEGFSRKRVNQRIEQTVHLVGMFALLGFMLYITVVKDLGLGKLFR
jgi:regulator of sigma E protease